MAQYLTSRVYVALEALYDRMAELEWPTVQGRTFGVSFGQPTPEPLEFAAIFTEVGATAEQRTSTRRTESMVLRVRIQTDAAHKTSIAALRRLSELSAVFEASMRDLTTGQPLTFSTAGLEVDVVLKADGASTVTPRVYPLDQGGYGAQADITFPFQAVI